MVSSPNTQGLYGAQGGAGTNPIGEVAAGKDPRDTGAEANAATTAMNDRLAAEKAAADKAAADAAAAKSAAAPTANDAYAQSLMDWQKGQQTARYYGGYGPQGYAMLVASMRNGAPAATNPTQQLMRNSLASTMRGGGGGGSTGQPAYGGGGHLR